MCMRVYTHVCFRIALHSCLMHNLHYSTHDKSSPFWGNLTTWSRRIIAFLPRFCCDTADGHPLAPPPAWLMGLWRSDFQIFAFVYDEDFRDDDGALWVRFTDICYCVWWGFWWWWQGFLGQIFRYLVATKLVDVDAHPPTRLLAGSLMFLFEERFRYLYIRAKRLGWSSHW